MKSMRYGRLRDSWRLPMPYRPARPCPGRGPRRGGCPNLIRGNARCCPECEPYDKQAVRQYNQHRDESPGRRFLHSTTWRRIRDAKLNQDPICERCLRGGLTGPVVRAATLVHHLDGNELNNDPDNHESLCNPCHEDQHRGERWGI